MNWTVPNHPDEINKRKSHQTTHQNKTKYDHIPWERKGTGYACHIGNHQVFVYICMHESEAGWKINVDGNLLGNYPPCLDEAKVLALDTLARQFQNNLAILRNQP